VAERDRERTSQFVAPHGTMPRRLLSFIAPPAVEQTAKTGHRGRSRHAFSNSRERLLGGYRWKCQTSTATPAEPEELPWGFS
jgi:hypothetical protein